jgi:type IV pilus assembly protein PilQ
MSMGSITGRGRELAALAVCGSLALGILACAASTATQSQPHADTIADVQVGHDGDTTVVTFLGPDHPVFTAFEQGEPERIVIDLASVRPGDELQELAVGDGLVESVSMAPFSTGLGDPMTRIEVRLAQKASYEVVPTETGLEVRVEAGEPLEDPWALGALPGDDVDPAAEPEAAGTWDDAGAPEDAGARADAGEADAAGLETLEPLDAAPVAAAPATALLGVEVGPAGEGAVVQLRADGMLDAESFTLDDPERLVIDLPGVVSRVDRERVEVGSPRVSRVRVGKHSDRVRVVIDAGEARRAFDDRRMIPSAGGLVVALGSGEPVDAAVKAALGGAPAPQGLAGWPGVGEDEMAQTGDGEPAPGDASGLETLQPLEEAADSAWKEPAGAEPESGLGGEPEAGEPVTIYGVEYDAQQGLDRVVVLGEQPFDYLVYEPDADTVVLSIERAVINPEAARRIAPEPGGPVSLVTAFEQPDVATSEVRVVVKRAPDLKPVVSRHGSVLTMDFPREGGVAATPPVLEGMAEAPLHGDGTGTAVEAATLTPVHAASGGSPLPAAVPAALAPGGSGAVPASLEPPAAIGLLEEGGLFDGKEYTGRRISLDFKDVEIADVLRLIAEVSDLNVIAGDEVAGRVTIRLVDVPWDQALDVILLTKNLGFMRVGNVLRIAPAEVIKQEEEMRLQERRAKEKLEDLVVKLQPVNYANVKDIEKMVKKLLSARGSVNIDQRTNTLIIKDIPSVIDEATALIKAIDTQTPQVMIEAKIVEANLEFSREFGTIWSFGAQGLTDAFDSGSAPRRDLGNDLFRLNGTGLGNNAQFVNPITSFPSAVMNLAGFILDEKINLQLQLQAAEVNGDGKVISSPRVVTLDNSKATIEQGVSIPFQTFENGDAQLEFIDAVLKLEVTPHITADKSIIMDVQVSRNAPDDSVFTLTGSPAIAKNEVETETLVKDGQTLVLGGIYVIDKSNRQSRVPYLHRIPLLGGVFRSDEISDSRKELLIFVTPHIVVPLQTAS